MARSAGRSVVVVAAVVTLLVSCEPVPPGRAQEAPKPLDLRNDPEIADVIEDLREEIPRRMAQQDLPGLAIALVDRDGIVWAQGFGTTQRDDGRPVDTETMFNIQSMSKTVTATGVLTAIRDGLVDLDEPITTYLPEFTVHSRHAEQPERRMTLRHFLTHRAGFTHEAPMGNNYDPSYPSWGEYIESISDTWLRYPVGERYSYSNLGVDLAGFILQTVSGIPFPEYMARHVLEPLGLERSSMDWDVIRADGNRAVGHAEGFDEVPLEYGLIPSGGFCGSVKDVAEFVRFHLNEGSVGNRQLIPRSILEEMYTIQFPVDGQVQGYGLGLGKYLRFGDYYLGHNGGGFGFLSHMAWYPQFGVGVVVLTNSTDNNLTGGFPVQVMSRVLRATLGRVPPEVRPFPDLEPVRISSERQRRLAGHYIGRGLEMSLELEEGGARFRVGNRSAPLRFLGPAEAFADSPEGRIRIRFSLDATGRPVYLEMAHNGQSADYNGGPADPPGPDRPEWGEYSHSVWGQQTRRIRLHRRNGYLYFDELRMEEYLPGFFFSSTGEALDLRSPVPTWRNIRLRKAR
jgi:CubicO group peptidase (beta-lactamase class C family)